MEGEVRRLKIELDVYSKTFVELRKKIVEAEDKHRAAERGQAALEAEMADLRVQLEAQVAAAAAATEKQAALTAAGSAAAEKEATAAAAEEAAAAKEDEFQQRLDRLRTELRIQWDLDHKVGRLQWI